MDKIYKNSIHEIMNALIFVMRIPHFNTILKLSALFCSIESGLWGTKFSCRFFGGHLVKKSTHNNNEVYLLNCLTRRLLKCRQVVKPIFHYG